LKPEIGHVRGLLTLQWLTMSFYENQKWPSFAQRLQRGGKNSIGILWCNASTILARKMSSSMEFFCVFLITKNKNVHRPLFCYFLLPMAYVVLCSSL